MHGISIWVPESYTVDGAYRRILIRIISSRKATITERKAYENSAE